MTSMKRLLIHFKDEINHAPIDLSDEADGLLFARTLTGEGGGVEAVTLERISGHDLYTKTSFFVPMAEIFSVEYVEVLDNNHAGLLRERLKR